MDFTYDEFIKIITHAPDSPENIKQCPVNKALDVLQGKWKEQIMFFLCKKGTCRFGELHHAYPQISKTMLSSALKQLESDGLIIRRQFDEMPVRTEYSLTESGKAFMPVFYALFNWGMKYGGEQFEPTEEARADMLKWVSDNAEV